MGWKSGNMEKWQYGKMEDAEGKGTDGICQWEYFEWGYFI